MARMLSQRIGDNIRRAREARGWSLEKVAARCVPATGYTTISRLEKGDRRLTLDWVERIAAALELDPVALLTGEGQKAPAEVPGMSEQVSNEVARVLAQVALQGQEPEPGIVQALSLMIQELSETFARHPQAYRDPSIALPVADQAARRFVRA